MFWRLSFYELTARIKLKFGQLHATTLSTYTAFAEVANAALGGGGETKEERNDLAVAPSYEMALSQINGALNFG